MQALDVPAQKYRLTSLGLVIDAALDLAEWMDLGAQLGQMYNATRWAIADWLVYGEGRGDWGEMYSQGLEVTGLDYGYLAHLAQVAKAFPHHTRVDGLSVSHHMAVLALPPEERMDALYNADYEDMTRDELRAYVKERRAELGAPDRALPRATSWRGYVREARHSEDGRVMVVIEFDQGADLARGDAVEVRVK